MPARMTADGVAPLRSAPDPIDRVRGALSVDLPEGSSDFDLNPDVVLPEGRRLREAAVLVPLLHRPEGLAVILTKRSSHLAHHPGQIAFPGGKIDPGDADAPSAALREAQEEIGLPPESVALLGHLPVHETVTGYRVHPVVGEIRAPFVALPEPGEVEEVFAVPLSRLADPRAYRIERRRWRNEFRSYYVIPYGPYYIWGATARMLMALARRMEIADG